MIHFDFGDAPQGALEIFQYLKGCANSLATDNYGNICDGIKQSSHGRVSVIPLGIGAPLSYIRSLCIANDVPWINALAVNKASWRPSESFLPSGVSWDPSHERLWRGMVLQVFAYDWSHVEAK